MAGFGKILQKIDPGNGYYERDKVKYEKLSQDPHDNEAEDDDVVFSQDGVVSNGHHESSQRNGHNGVRLEKAKILKNSDVEVRVKKLRILTKYRALCFCCILLLVIAAGLFIGLVWPLISKSAESQSQSHSGLKGHLASTPDWKHTFKDTTSESCLRLYDVDDDGRDDVILGIDELSGLERAMDLNHDNMEEFCAENGKTTPCLGKLVALRGYDGALLWSIYVYGTVFEINCGKVDINKDGYMDCIGTGRLGTCVAFDPRNGNVLWRVETSLTHELWNTYNVVVLPDLTDDGVPEILLPNGGDPRFAAEEHVRLAGRLIMLDGATGESLGRHFEIADAWGEKETYMSPVLHETRDGSLYILYGSGGETVPGSFYAISVPDYYRYVKSLDRGAKVPDTLKGKYSDFPGVYRNPQGIIAIYNSTIKGVMVPPVLIDVSGDGVRDILMSAYDGTMIMYNGQTLQALWTNAFPGFEGYSSPAPGYLNDDDVPDFMFHVSLGTWDAGYNYSLTIALDGKTGVRILTINTTRYEMSSDLIVRTTEKHRDAFIFRVQRNIGASMERKKRSLFDRQYPRGHSQAANNPYNYNPRPNRYGHQVPQDENDAYGYRPSYNYEHARSRDQLSKSRYGTDESQDWPGYRSRSSYALPNLDSYQDYDDSDLSQRYGTGREGIDPEQYIDPADANIGYDFQSQFSNSDTDKDAPFKSKDIKRPEVFHPDPQKVIGIDGNEACKNGKTLSRTTEIYIIDGSTMAHPLRLHTVPSYKVYYNLTKEEIAESGRERRQGGEEYVDPRQGAATPLMTNADEMCSVMSASEHNTGAIGDVDGDGDLDLMFTFVMNGQKHDKYGNDFKMIADVNVVKLDLGELMKSAQTTDLEVAVAPGMEPENKVALKYVKFREFKSQPWTAYMGAQGDSVYRQT